jgi:hypothetical protein
MKSTDEPRSIRIATLRVLFVFALAGNESGTRPYPQSAHVTETVVFK